jgi:hypothetical protein
MSGCCAYLRVYEPAAVMDDAWREVALPRAEALVEERRLTLQAALGRRTGGRLAYALTEDDIRYLAPLDLDARRATGFDEFVRPLAPVHQAAFVPDSARPSARRDGSVHILTSAWNVPIRWFALFDDSERVLELAPGERSLLYRTTMANARRRLGHALPVLQATISDTDAVAEALRLSSWLEQFNGLSRVELDYAGLVHMLEDSELRTDRSAQDTADSIEALRSGDGVSAGQAYLRVVTRWRRAASLVLAG